MLCFVLLFQSCSLVWAQSPPPIVGGEETAEFEAVGALTLLRDSGSYSFCTATLVDAYVAVTAAHCVRDMLEYQEDEPVYLTLGTLEMPLERLLVAGSNTLPTYDATAYTDLAVVFLDTPAQTPPLSPWQPELDLVESGDLATVVGYGRTHSAEGDSAGIKRSAEVSIYNVAPEVVVLRAFDEPAGGCHGDSGGPVFRSGQSTWVPIAAMVSIVDLDGDGEACGDMTMAVLFEPHLEWLQGEIDSVQPEPEPEPEPEPAPVEETRGGGGCSSAPAPGALWWLSGALVLIWRRFSRTQRSGAA